MNIFCGARLARTLLLGAAALVVAAIAPSRVQADPIVFAPNGTGPGLDVGSFGFDTGNSLAVSSVPLTVGKEFQLYYQSRLSNLTTDGGATVTPPGLNGTSGAPAYEITAVLSVTEKVTGVFNIPGLGNVATFTMSTAQSPESFLRYYYHTGLTSDNFTGAGFQLGTKILDASPTAALPNSGSFTVSSVNGSTPVGASKFDTFDKPLSPPGIAYATTLSVVGAGTSQFGANVLSYDPAFFKSPINTVTFNSFNSTPFDATTPSLAFNSKTGLNDVVAKHGAVNGVTGPDFQFESRASASFTAVPEPASITLVGLGLVGLIGVGRYRRNRQS